MWPVSDSFKAALRAPVHTVIVKVEVLDDDLSVIEDGTFGASVLETGPNAAVVDGTVDVDITRGNRRTFQLSLLNNNAEFSPGGRFAGYFYLDRVVRIWRGVQFGGGSVELVPLGTFLVDTPDILVERNMSVVTLAGQDFWKKLAKSQFTVPTTYPAGMGVNAVIDDMAAACGVFDTLYDPLTDRPTNSKTLNVARHYEVGDRRGEEIVKLATNFGLDVYFDPMGRLVTQDMRDPSAAVPVWTYEGGNESLLTQLQYGTTDDDLYNHVVVTGTGDPTQTYRSERSDTDPTSVSRIAKIGDRVYRYESPVLASQEAVDAASLTLFYKKRALTERLRLEGICNPALEGNDVVAITEDAYSGLSADRFLLSSFSVPLSTSKQQLRMTRVLSLT